MYILTYHSDPSHGWLEVYSLMLEELGIVDRISSYSYIHGNRVYLEEDSDAGIFLKAMKEQGKPYEIKKLYTDNPSFIRSLHPFPCTINV